jgi:hypothetical protein
VLSEVEAMGSRFVRRKSMSESVSGSVEDNEFESPGSGTDVPLSPARKKKD